MCLAKLSGSVGVWVGVCRRILYLVSIFGSVWIRKGLVRRLRLFTTLQ